MSINLIHTLQKHLAYADLHRINPNTLDVSNNFSKDRTSLLGQAAIASVLAAVYQYSKEESDAQFLLNGNLDSVWLEVIFGSYPVELEQKIAQYTGCSNDLVKQHLQLVAEKTVADLRAYLGKNATGAQLRHLMSTQRNHILAYLPGNLSVGNMVNNSGLDDSTNKMHGPFSDFMHFFEEFLSDPQMPLY